jgi:hypothetical protein
LRPPHAADRIMIFRQMFGDVITYTFDKEVGKFQVSRNRREGGEPRAMLVSFKTKTDHTTEEGYRHVDLLIYGPMNYVQVWVRERWDVIPIEDLEDDADGDTRLKAGCSYTKGETNWKLIADHDSGWREGVHRFLQENEDKIVILDSLEGWFRVVRVPAELST